MLNWGIIGAGGIARVFCNAMRFSKTGRVVAVASRTRERLDRLAGDFALPRRYTTYEALLADGDVDAVYIATIHPLHVECAIQAAQAGKHILVEKPIAMNYGQAAAMIDAARANDVFLMEAFMYRCHPQTRKLVELVQEGAIGQVRMVRAVFSYYAAYDPASRAYAKASGGGGILDVGCYPASMVRLIAGAAAGQPFLDPVQVKGCGRLGPTGVDHYAAATLQFENDVVAQIVTGVACQIPDEVSVYGDEGMLTLSNPWLPSSPCRSAPRPLPPDTAFPSTTIVLRSHGAQEPEEIAIDVDRDLFTYEADTVAENIAHRQAPAMSWDDSLGNMRLLDRWRQEIGLVYEQDERSR